MTLLSVVKDVCAVVGVQLPTSVFSNIGNNRTMQEMLALANETVQRIAYDTRDWTRFRKVATFAGDGAIVPPAITVTGTTAFDLPGDYKRMMTTTNIWRSTYQQAPMIFIPDTDEWLRRRARGWTHGNGEWTNLGGQIHIFPPMAVGQTAFFTYLHKNCVGLSGGGISDNFVADGDSFLLDERLMRLGMIWQWKAEKGSPYNEDMATYETALAYLSKNDSPAPIIGMPMAVDGWQYARNTWVG